MPTRDENPRGLAKDFVDSLPVLSKGGTMTGPACAHLKVYWTEQITEGVGRIGWWECVLCRTPFLPDTSAKPMGQDAVADRALRVIKAVKERYCYHVCKVVHVDWGQRRVVTSEDAGVEDVHETLCQEMQEVEKLLES